MVSEVVHEDSARHKHWMDPTSLQFCAACGWFSSGLVRVHFPERAQEAGAGANPMRFRSSPNLESSWSVVERIRIVGIFRSSLQIDMATSSTRDSQSIPSIPATSRCSVQPTLRDDKDAVRRNTRRGWIFAEQERDARFSSESRTPWFLEEGEGIARVLRPASRQHFGKVVGVATCVTQGIFGGWYMGEAHLRSELRRRRLDPRTLYRVRARWCRLHRLCRRSSRRARGTTRDRCCFKSGRRVEKEYASDMDHDQHQRRRGSSLQEGGAEVRSDVSSSVSTTLRGRLSSIRFPLY